MKRAWKSAVCTLVSFAVVICGASVFAWERENPESVVSSMAEYLCRAVPNPQVGSIGGEWAVLGLARSGCSVPEGYFENYYHAVEEYVKACKGELHEKKYTEYSRVITALTAIGKDPSDVAGYNLLTALGDYDKTVWQGMNGPVWALIALDSGDYEIPQNPSAETQATREMYLKRILDCQLADGGWSLFGGTAAAEDSVSDPDITGMALQALAKYQNRDDVRQATEKALECMSKQQDENGGFSGWGSENSESCVQMLVALCELGIPADDARFVKNGKTIPDSLMTYYEEGKGFLHSHSGGGESLMATEQGFYALVAVCRTLEGKSSLYRMTDSVIAAEPEKSGGQTVGLPGRIADIHVPELRYLEKSFADVYTHTYRTAIENLAARGIINGKSDAAFEPEEAMTRAEFAAIVVRSLGLPVGNGAEAFADVRAGAWYYSYVNTACAYNIVNGVSETEFMPDSSITREEAAVMVARAAKLCGMETETELFAARDVLAGFVDYVKVSDWAMTSLAFCYENEILPSDELEILPKQPITRAEIARMLFQLLDRAKLL